MPYRGWNIINEARAKNDMGVIERGLEHWHAEVANDLEDVIAAARKLQRSLEGRSLESPFDESALRALRDAMHKIEDEIPVLATLQFAYPHVSEELRGRA